MIKAFKFFAALCLLPTLFFLAAETARVLASALGDFYAALSFALGGAVYCAVHFGYYNFSRPYVFGHEITHALAALVCGCRIRDISVKENSGYVKMDRYNAFVVLAPYFVPLYTLVTAFVYFVAELFVDITPYRAVFVFTAGFFTAFHWVHTCITLFETDQPDLTLAGGKVFSVIMIACTNLAVLALVLKVLFPEKVSLLPGLSNIVWGTVNVWRILLNYIVETGIHFFRTS